MKASAATEKPLDEASAQLFLKAMEEFFETGRMNTHCDVCGSVICFEQLGDAAWQHSCRCGKFNGTLRGI